jgi:hypothetical protein
MAAWAQQTSKSDIEVTMLERARQSVNMLRTADQASSVAVLQDLREQITPQAGRAPAPTAVRASRSWGIWWPGMPSRAAPASPVQGMISPSVPGPISLESSGPTTGGMCPCVDWGREPATTCADSGPESAAGVLGLLSQAFTSG